MINRFFKTFFLLLLISASTYAQILTPTKWTWQPSKTAVKVGEEIDLIFKVSIDHDWYMYANEFDPECGPMLTTVTLTPDPSFAVVGTLKAINPKSKHDEIFDCDVKIFEKTGEFRQKIKVLSGNLKLSGIYEGQVCTELEGKCIPFDGEFTIAGISISGEAKKTEIKKEEPKSEPTPEVTDTTEKFESPVKKNNAEINGPTLDESILEGESSFGNDSFWSLLVLAFIAGLTSLITPCVFPMIPMTVTFFLKDTQTKREGVKKAIIFGFKRNGHQLGAEPVHIYCLHHFRSFVFRIV